MRYLQDHRFWDASNMCGSWQFSILSLAVLALQVHQAHIRTSLDWLKINIPHPLSNIKGSRGSRASHWLTSSTLLWKMLQTNQEGLFKGTWPSPNSCSFVPFPRMDQIKWPNQLLPRPPRYCHSPKIIRQPPCSLCPIKQRQKLHRFLGRSEKPFLTRWLLWSYFPIPTSLWSNFQTKVTRI